VSLTFDFDLFGSDFSCDITVGGKLQIYSKWDDNCRITAFCNFFFIIEGSAVSLDESGRNFFFHKKKLKNDPVLNNLTIYSKMNAIFKLESSK
jgi:hypothetical protein